MFSLFVYKGEFLRVLEYDGISFLFRARVGFLSELCRSFALGVVRETLFYYFTIFITINKAPYFLLPSSISSSCLVLILFIRW